jgi:hypothetical protein
LTSKAIFQFSNFGIFDVNENQVKRYHVHPEKIKPVNNFEN